MKTSYVIPAAIVIGGIIVAGAVYVSNRVHSTSSGSGNPALVRPVDSTDHIFGNPAAPVKIVEYSDFDCEYCKQFDGTLHQIIADAGASGQVAWVFREFPLTEIHPGALQAAEAAECAAVAGGNDSFWAFETLLFANQPADPSLFGTYAKQANVPGDAFASCYSEASSTVYARIMADRENAFAIGANGTPYALIVVDGKAPVVIGGAYPYAAVKALVEKALQSAQ